MDEGDLVDRAAAGDGDARAELAGLHVGHVYDHLIRTLRNQDLASDLTRATFLRALRGIAGLPGDMDFRKWALTIARVMALEQLGPSAHLPWPGRAGGTAEDRLQFAVPGPARDSGGEAGPAAAALVWEAVEPLEPRRYSMLDLYVRRQFSIAQLARALAVSNHNVRVLLDQLRATIEESIGALVLVRVGRQDCQGLSGLFPHADYPRLSAEDIRRAEQHAAGCAACQLRVQRAPPVALLSTLALVPVPAATSSAVVEDATDETNWAAQAGASERQAGVERLRKSLRAGRMGPVEFIRTRGPVILLLGGLVAAAFWIHSLGG